MKTTIFLLLFSLLAIPLLAQIGGTGFSPSPIWPGDKNGGVAMIPPDVLKNHYVFYDVDNGQVVLVYPDNPDTPAKVQRRLNLNNAVAPSVTFSVSKNKNNPASWDYLYGVTNDGKKGKKAIAEMVLVVGDTAATFDNPAGWNGQTNASNASSVKAALGRGRGALVRFAKNDPLGNQTDGAPGTTMTGLVVSSTFKPGFTLAYFRNAGGDLYGGLDNVPEPVLLQLVPWQAVEQNTKAVFTMGPKFDPATALPEIVADYLAGFNRLLRQGDLQSSSAFVQSVLATLTNYMKAGANAPPLTFNVAPTTALETQLLAALQAATQ